MNPAFKIDHGFFIVLFNNKVTYKEYSKSEFNFCYKYYKQLWQSEFGSNQIQKTALKNAKYAFALTHPNLKRRSTSTNPQGQLVSVYEYV